MPDEKIKKLYSKPTSLLLLIISIIFLVEFILMAWIFAGSALPAVELALIDATVLSALIIPALYGLCFLPLHKYVSSLKTADHKISQLNYAIQKSQELGQVGTWTLDLVANELIWTDEVYRIFGVPIGRRLSYDDFLGRVHPKDRNFVEQQWQAALEGAPYDIKHRLLIDGKVKWVREKAEMVFDDGGKIIRGVGFVQDITLFEELKEKAIRAGQMATVGEISTMIAHEVNNPLSGVIGYAQVFSNRACEDCRDKELLDRIVKEGERISKIVGGLLSFTHNRVEDKKPHDLHPIIVDALSLIKSQLTRREINLEIDFAENLPRVVCIPQQIEQVVLNVIRNAYQALLSSPIENGNQGLICIRSNLVVLNNREYVQVSIANNGPNIPESLLSRITEPFFTTKPPGIGTGLGLSISNDILKDHDGYFDIKSPPGEHTEMILGLPVAPIEQPAVPSV